MNIEQVFYEYNPWWEESYQLGSIIKRDVILAKLYPLLATRDVIMLTGLRRVGKTVIMRCLIDYLINVKAILPQHCFYISLDDYLLTHYSLVDIVNEYRKIHGISVKQKIYVFLDEITYVENFQIQLKNFYDKQVIKCIVSSSSSSILKDDSAHLTGRKRVIEINPLDFSEYLTFKKIKLAKADRALLENHFLDYMQVGGMPEYVLHQEREYLVNLIDDILMKDIVAFHKIRNPSIIKDYFMLLMERAGKQISSNKIARILQISPDTASRYLNMFEETYLIHLISRHGKTNEQLLSAKKVYATDLGMRNIIVGFRDKGAIFENLVFMKIKDQKPQYVYENGQEIDFYFNDTLLEAKFQCDLEGKQLGLFNDFNSKQKLLVRNCFDLENI